MNDVLQRPLRGPAVFNPNLLSKEELILGFVARRDVLALFEQDLRRVAAGGSVQHHLVVGQRGMGKTTLLRRLRHLVDDDPVLRDAWLPLNFPEEQYDVAQLSDFYLNCVDALSDALEARGKLDAVKALDAAVDAIPDGPEKERAARALDVLIRTAKRQRARLLLLLDNIDMLFDRLEKDHWTLRELLSSQDRLCVVGTSAAAIETTYDYGKAFYDFFHVHHLHGLNDAECREVLLTLSRVFETPQVEEWLNREPARLRALRLLTGGNPRTLVLLHGVTASSPGGDVRSDLERLLDQCTPLYKHRFEALSDQAQRVVHALALHWQPASAADVAREARLDINATSSQLARLVSDGVVEKVPFVPETKTGFQVAERFFNIWYLMRSSRRVRRRLVWLVEFLKMLYEGEELREHARTTLRGVEGARGKNERMRFAESALAFAEAVDEEPLKMALEGAAVYALTAQRETRDKIAEIIELDGADAGLKPIVDRHKAAAELREAVLSAPIKFEGWSAKEFADLLGGSFNLSKEEKALTAAQMGRLRKSQIQDMLSILQEERAEWGQFLGPTTSEILRRATQLGYVEWPVDWREGKNFDDVKAAAIVLEAPCLVAFALADARLMKGESFPSSRLAAVLPPSEMPFGWLAYGDLLHHEGQIAAAERALRKAMDLDKERGDAAARLALMLTEVPNRLDDAEAAFRAAVAAPQAAPAKWRHWGWFLAHHRNDAKEAAKAYRRALELQHDDPKTWRELGALYFWHLRQNEAAEKAYLQAANLAPGEASYWTDLGQVRGEMGKYAEAEEAFLRSVDLRPEDARTWSLLGNARFLSGAQQTAFSAYRRATELSPTTGQVWNDFAWHLYLANETTAETEHASREALRLLPDDPRAAHTAATILAHFGKWEEAAPLARRFLKEGSPDWHTDVWDELLLFFREAALSGHAADAVTLLDETDLGERWFPLREALRILGAGNPLLLRTLAPEVREPTRLLMERLSAPAQPFASEPVTTTSTVSATASPQSPPKAKKAARSKPAKKTPAAATPPKKPARPSTKRAKS